MQRVGRQQEKYSYRPPHSHYNRHKNKHALYTYIHLLFPTKCNNRLLRTPPLHISSSEEILPASLVAPVPTFEQINHPSSNHTCAKSTPNHIHYHYSPSVTLTHTTHDTHHLINIDHIRTTLSPLDRLRWSDGTAGQMDGKAYFDCLLMSI